MTKGDCIGPYTFYSASFTIAGGLSYAAKLSVTAGSSSDSFNKASDLSGSCATFSGTASCTTPGSGGGDGGGNDPDASSTVASTAASSSAAEPSSTSSVVKEISSSDVPSSTTTTSSSTPTATGPARKLTVAGYTRLRCATEGSGVRALTGASFAYDTMTLESCAANCTGFAYFGTEYSRECFCGNTLASSSSEAPDSECNMLCAGDSTEYCGAGNRLELYSTTAGTGTGTATSSAAQPTATLGRKDAVGDYVFVGCQTEATQGGRALEGKFWADDGMTLEGCAEACEGWEYFGAEYGRECEFSFFFFFFLPFFCFFLPLPSFLFSLFPFPSYFVSLVSANMTV